MRRDLQSLFPARLNQRHDLLVHQTFLPMVRDIHETRIQVVQFLAREVVTEFLRPLSQRVPSAVYLCLRFSSQIAMCPVRLEARMDSLFSFPVRLFHPPTTCRFIPAHSG
jgi:hypothetical protein